MSTTETENGTGALEAYVPFTPFEESYAFEAQPSMLEQPENAQLFTPFVSEYEGLEAPVSAEAQELRELLYQLYDQELDETLGQIAEEAWHAASERAAMFGETIGSTERGAVPRGVDQPASRQAETLIDNVVGGVREHRHGVADRESGRRDFRALRAAGHRPRDVLRGLPRRPRQQAQGRREEGDRRRQEGAVDPAGRDPAQAGQARSCRR